jgi:hypothetical protein
MQNWSCSEKWLEKCFRTQVVAQTRGKVVQNGLDGVLWLLAGHSQEFLQRSGQGWENCLSCFFAVHWLICVGS